MWRVAVMAVVTACIDDSGYARKVSEGTGSARAVEDGPEPPGGPPSCVEVAERVVAQLDFDREITADTKAGRIAVSGETMRATMIDRLARLCRSKAWSLETRQCVAAWQGSYLSDREKLRAACPEVAR
jgi:hypothetical protein